MIVTSLTFCSTVNMIINVGAVPILIDIDLNTLQINDKLIESKITKKTKAIIVVHMHGRPTKMDKIIKIRNKYSLKIIEDCAHAIETKYNGKHAGTFGDFSCFSFYSTKNITTVEGGFLICKKYSDSIKAKKLSLHGMSKDAFKRFSKKEYVHYDVDQPGYKYNLTDFNAAIGIEQLKNINKKYKRRKYIWNIYQSEFKKTKFIIPSKIPKNIKHAYHLYFLMLKNDSKKIRDSILLKLHKKGIGTGLHYQSIADLDFYKKNVIKNKNEYKNSIYFGRNSFSIPLTPYLSENDIYRVVNTIMEIDKNYN